MKRTLCFALVAFFSIVQANSQVITYSDSREAEGFSLKSQNPVKIEVTYSIHGFSMEDINIRGEAMKQVRLDNHFLPGDEGSPDLPGSGRYIALPQGARPVLHVKSFTKEI